MTGAWKDKEVPARLSAPWAMVLAVCIWGFGYIVTKSTLNDEIPPLLLTAASYGYGALGGVPVLIWKRKELKKRGVMREGAVLGAVLFVSRYLQVIGCSASTAGKNAFITAAYVVIVPLLMCVLLRERLEIKSMAASVMTLAGIGLVAVNESLNGVNTGDLITFAASAGFALHIVYNGRFAARHDPWMLGALQLVFAAAFSLGAASVPVALYNLTHKAWMLSGIWIADCPNWHSLKFHCGMLYNGVLGMTVGFAFQSFGQKYVSQNRAAMILSLESVSGALFSAALLKERFGGKTVAGCLIIFVAILISTHKGKNRKEAEGIEKTDCVQPGQEAEWDWE